MAQKLEQQLKELGSKLDTPPSTKDALVKLLKVRIPSNVHSFCPFELSTNLNLTNFTRSRFPALVASVTPCLVAEKFF